MMQLMQYLHVTSMIVHLPRARSINVDKLVPVKVTI